MKKFVTWGAFGLLTMALTVTLAACHDDDEKEEYIEPPVVEEVETYSVSGVISAISGTPIQGATVTLASTSVSLSVTTGADGVYQFTDLDEGAYNVSVTANGKISKSDVISVTGDEVHALTWSAALASEQSVVEIKVAEDGSSKGEVQAEALQGNEKAEVKVEVTVTADAINVEELSGNVGGGSTTTSEPVKITLTPVYSEEEAAAAASSRAALDLTGVTENKLITGTTLACNYSNAKIADGKSIDLTFNVDESTVSSVKAMRYTNGAWVEIASDNVQMSGNTVVVKATEFTTYALFCPITFSMTTANSPLNFVQNEWNNFYGSDPVSVENATYTYRVGLDITAKASNVFEALLLEALARMYGATAKDVQGIYPVSVTLPVGTKLELSGYQEVNTVKAASGSRSISATTYGDVTVKATTSSRSHNGGSNGI